MSSYSGSDQADEISEHSDQKLSIKQQVTSVKTAVTTATSQNNKNVKKVPSSSGSRNNEELVESGSEEEDDEEEEEQSEVSSHNDSEEAKAFLRVPLTQEQLYNDDGTEKVQAQTKLMLRLAEIDVDDCSDDCMDNSFADHLSDEDEDDDEENDEDLDEDSDDKSEENDEDKKIDDNQQEGEECEEQEVESPEPQENDEEEESDEDDDESPAASPKATIKKQLFIKPAVQKQKTIFDIVDEPEQPKKIRKSIMNTACTEYDVVKRVAKKSQGWRLKEFEEDHEGAVIYGEGGKKLSKDWDVSWHDLGITADFLSKMQPYQKVNQYPGMYVITRKNYLARNLMKMQRAFPDEYKFFPKTWLIPQEATDFRKQFVDANGKPLQKKKTYIVKPEGLSQGQGIYLSRNCEKIIDNCSAEGGFIVQDYLDKPHLVDDLKYDLRIYVLLYGINPMRVYIHEQGIARFATEPYTAPKASNLDNLFMHLTNYAINKTNAAFKQNVGGAGKGVPASEEESEEGEEGSEEEESGHKRSLNAILKLLYEQGADADRIMDEIRDIVVKTLIVGQPYMSHIYRSCQPDDYDNSMCFQILGFDIMIDKYFKPWLIEVNQSPSFATDSPLDYEVKKAVLKDSFRLLNVNQERREAFIKMKQKQMAERILTGKQDKLDPEQKKKLKEERLAQRFELENAQMKPGSSNKFEIVFPRLYDEELNAKYEVFIKKANDIWDEFTTGTKGKKRAAEMAAEKEKAEIAEKKRLHRKEQKEAREKAKREQAENSQKMEQEKAETIQIPERNYQKETKCQPKYPLGKAQPSKANETISRGSESPLGQMTPSRSGLQGPQKRAFQIKQSNLGSANNAPEQEPFPIREQGYAPRNVPQGSVAKSMSGFRVPPSSFDPQNLPLGSRQPLQLVEKKIQPPLGLAQQPWAAKTATDGFLKLNHYDKNRQPTRLESQNAHRPVFYSSSANNSQHLQPQAGMNKMHSNVTALPPPAYPNGDNTHHNRHITPYGANGYGGGKNGSNGFGGRKVVVNSCKIDGADLELSQKITKQLQQVAFGHAEASIDLDHGRGGHRQPIPRRSNMKTPATHSNDASGKPSEAKFLPGAGSSFQAPSPRAGQALFTEEPRREGDIRKVGPRANLPSDESHGGQFSMKSFDNSRHLNQAGRQQQLFSQREAELHQQNEDLVHVQYRFAQPINQRAEPQNVLPRNLAKPDNRQTASRASNGGRGGGVVSSAPGASAHGGNRVIQINQKHLSRGYDNQSDSNLGTDITNQNAGRGPMIFQGPPGSQGGQVQVNYSQFQNAQGQQVDQQQPRTNQRAGARIGSGQLSAYEKQVLYAAYNVHQSKPQQQYVHQTPQQPASRKFPGLMPGAHRGGGIGGDTGGHSTGPFMQQTLVPPPSQTSNLYASSLAQTFAHQKAPPRHTLKYQQQEGENSHPSKVFLPISQPVQQPRPQMNQQAMKLMQEQRSRARFDGQHAQQAAFGPPNVSLNQNFAQQMIPKGPPIKSDGRPQQYLRPGVTQARREQNLFHERTQPDNVSKASTTKHRHPNNQGQSTEHNLFYQRPTPGPQDKRQAQRSDDANTALLIHLQRTTAGIVQPADPAQAILKNESASTYFVPKGSNFNPNRRTRK